MGATVDAIQQALDPQGTGKVAQIIKEETVGATNLYTVLGITLCPGRCKDIPVLSSRTAAQAASDIRAALLREF